MAELLALSKEFGESFGSGLGFLAALASSGLAWTAQRWAFLNP
jgi:hypothetical protein